ncbi:hypothetical protein [Kitasatospora kifunensis]|uniref:Uncharacterized protein n=1 Tax=Kitasatospora kifunensis TaxID=58351 RepID=A0A7W7RBT0_KITKI|nr:hypothetical protein [Kitasatospora kifunensis]MBB4929091.1 hypothetical protein [Kitasatospora kifunensis]
MHAWLDTLEKSAATAVILAFILSRFSPRYDARSVRIKAAWADRDQFSKDVLTILAAAGRLLAVQVPNEASEVMRSRLEAERARWAEQIDVATRNLVDNMERYLLGYPNRLGLHDLLGRYAAAARFIWISERSEERRVEMVRDLSAHIQGIVFAKASYKLGHLTDHRTELRRLLEVLETPETPELAAVPPC